MPGLKGCATLPGLGRGSAEDPGLLSGSLCRSVPEIRLLPSCSSQPLCSLLHTLPDWHWRLLQNMQHFLCCTELVQPWAARPPLGHFSLAEQSVSFLHMSCGGRCHQEVRFGPSPRARLYDREQSLRLSAEEPEVPRHGCVMNCAALSAGTQKRRGSRGPHLPGLSLSRSEVLFAGRRRAARLLCAAG